MVRACSAETRAIASSAGTSIRIARCRHTRATLRPIEGVHGRLLLVAFTEAAQAKTPPSVGIAISDIRRWLEEAGLTITATNVLPGDVLDISLLVSEKNKDRS